MLFRSLIFSALILFAVSVYAQTERKSIRKGNNAFEDNDFVESEVQYRKALEANTHSFKGKFNLADALYKQEKYDESLKTMEEINQAGLSNEQKAMIYHNKGNALFKQQKFQESIDAYKNALKLNPYDAETKYNLSEAQRMLKQQQQQQNNDNKDNKDNKNNKDNKDNKDQNKDDKKDNQDKNKDQNKDKQDNKEQKQQEQQPKISKQDAERMLQAIQNNEKDIQEKMKQEKAKAAKVRVIKNW